MDNGKVVWEYTGKGDLGNLLKRLDALMDKLDASTKKFEGDANKAFDKAASGAAKAKAAVDNVTVAYHRNGGSLENIKRQLDNLHSAQDKTFNPRRLAAYNQEIKRLETLMRNNQNLGMPGAGRNAVSRGGGRFGDFMGQMPGQMGMLGMMSNPYVIGGAVAAGGLMAANGMANDNLAWNKDIAKINGTTRFGDSGKAVMSNRLLDIASDYKAGGVSDIPAAYEKVVSISNDAKKALDNVNKSADVSLVSFTDIGTVAESGARSLEALGKNAPAIEDLFDTYLKARRVGAVEFSQLANDMPRLLALRPMNTSYKDVAGTYSFMSAILPGQDAATMLQNAFVKVGDKQSMPNFKKAGIRQFNADGSARGFIQILDDIKVKYDRLNNDISKTNFLNTLFQDQQAMIGVKTIMGNFEKFKGIINDVSDAHGELESQLKNADYGASKIQEATNKWDVFKIKLGERIAPIKIGLAEFGTKMLMSEDDRYNDYIKKYGKDFNQIYAAGFKKDDFKRKNTYGVSPWVASNDSITTQLGSHELSFYGKYSKQLDYAKTRAAQDSFDLANPDIAKYKLSNVLRDGMKPNPFPYVNQEAKDKAMLMLGSGNQAGTETFGPQATGDSSTSLTQGTKQIKSVIINIGVVKAADTIITKLDKNGLTDTEGLTTDQLIREIYNAERIAG